MGLERKVFFLQHQIISSLGFGSNVNWQGIKSGATGIKLCQDSYGNFPLGLIENLVENNYQSRFESLLIKSLQKFKGDFELWADPKTLILISTTKGNIEKLAEDHEDFISNRLERAMQIVKDFTGTANVQIISNACISGVLAAIVAQRMISCGRFDRVVCIGIDVIALFIYKGFASLNAMSQSLCRPFDADRDGINLGEACAIAVFGTCNENSGPSIEVLAGTTTNDANHISGPSRTGEPLAMAIENCLQMNGLSNFDIDFISAHGTATVFNDEMESRAFTLTNLQNTPCFSLKANIGHTLGAAGLAELIICKLCLSENTLVPSLGFENQGVSEVINISRHRVYRPLKYALKTASGFGGCNAAIVLKKNLN